MEIQNQPIVSFEILIFLMQKSMMFGVWGLAFGGVLFVVSHMARIIVKLIERSGT